jgi:hypothetical protein
VPKEIQDLRVFQESKVSWDPRVLLVKESKEQRDKRELLVALVNTSIAILFEQYSNNIRTI